VGIRLLEGVVGTHAHVKRYDVGLTIGKVIAGGWKMDRVAIDGEHVARHVVAVSDPFEKRSVSGQDSAKLGVPIAAWCRIDWRYRQAVFYRTKTLRLRAP
jgi:hypothetical protein